MGSSIYHLGIQTRRWSQSQELAKLTEAMYNARELAMNRMDAEAIELGADGVVGVRLDVNYYEWGSDTAEFIALGTAVKAEDGRSYRNNQGKPFTSDLSGQDFWTLMQTGHVPLGLVMGTCVYHIAHRGLGQTLRTAGQNVELPNFTQALYEARELAMTRMQDEANELGATGIVGVRLEEKTHMWGDHTIEFLSLGTAVAKTDGDHTDPRAPDDHLARRLMTAPTSPEAPPRSRRHRRPATCPRRRRGGSAPGAWSSGLSVADFASCLAMGMEPVGFVQGYAVMQWSWYASTYYRTVGLAACGPAATGARGSTRRRWQCPHGFVGRRAPHLRLQLRADLGREQLGQRAGPWPTAGWWRRPTALGAHGVIGVVDDMHHLAGTGAAEFQIRGTAVVGARSRPAAAPVHHLPLRPTAGQADRGRLRAGSVVAALSSVQMFGYCITHYQLAGTAAGNWSGGRRPASTPSSRWARPSGPPGTSPASTSGASSGATPCTAPSLEQFEHEVGEGDLAIQCHRSRAPGCGGSRTSTRFPTPSRWCGWYDRPRRPSCSRPWPPSARPAPRRPGSGEAAGRHLGPVHRRDAPAPLDRLGAGRPGLRRLVVVDPLGGLAVADRRDQPRHPTAFAGAMSEAAEQLRDGVRQGRRVGGGRGGDRACG